MNISYKEFEQHMNDIKHDYEYYDAVCDAVESDFMYENLRCAGLALDLLAQIMEDDDDLIGYFIFELDWGKEYEDGCLTDEDGNSIRLATLRDLYNLLTEDT